LLNNAVDHARDELKLNWLIGIFKEWPIPATMGAVLLFLTFLKAFEIGPWEALQERRAKLSREAGYRARSDVQNAEKLKEAQTLGLATAAHMRTKENEEHQHHNYPASATLARSDDPLEYAPESPALGEYKTD